MQYGRGAVRWCVRVRTHHRTHSFTHACMHIHTTAVGHWTIVSVLPSTKRSSSSRWYLFNKKCGAEPRPRLRSCKAVVPHRSVSRQAEQAACLSKKWRRAAGGGRRRQQQSRQSGISSSGLNLASARAHMHGGLCKAHWPSGTIIEAQNELLLTVPLETVRSLSLVGTRRAKQLLDHTRRQRYRACRPVLLHLSRCTQCHCMPQLSAALYAHRVLVCFTVPCAPCGRALRARPCTAHMQR